MERLCAYLARKRCSARRVLWWVVFYGFLMVLAAVLYTYGEEIYNALGWGDVQGDFPCTRALLEEMEVLSEASFFFFFFPG